MQKGKIRLLTLISYRFLPAKLGGHLAHLYFHNFISEYLDSIIISSSDNEFAVESIHFRLYKVFRNKYLTYCQFFYLPNIFRLINKENIDVVMCSHPYLGLMGYIAAKFKNKPLISYSHNIESERFRTLNKWWWKILFYYEKWVMQRSQLIFFVTEEDRLWAINSYKLMEKKCIVSPFGININEAPTKDIVFRERLCNTYNIKSDDRILYFAGSYNYQPNDEAVEFICDEIYPRLLKLRSDLAILIVGKGLNKELRAKIDQTNGKIKYVGFIEDINDVLFSADLMLNPMLSGGGIKTKAVEALGNNIKVVSTVNGSFGLDRNACENMLWISKDGDWDQFTHDIILALDQPNAISPKFYEHYYWGKVTKRFSDEISKLD